MTMQEAEALNRVLVDLRNQYREAVHAREGASLEVLREAKDVMSWAHEDWAAGRLRPAVNGYCEALRVLKQA